MHKCPRVTNRGILILTLALRCVLLYFSKHFHFHFHSQNKL